jgi:Uma2 family endonuclease
LFAHSPGRCAVDRRQLLTDQEYLALGDSTKRIELLDSILHGGPQPTPRHQHISSELMVALRPAARKAGLYVHEAVNVRLQPGRIPIPDLTITELIDFDQSIVEAGSVRLVCEIVSPSNAAADRVTKMHFYASAGIPWYLLVEQETGALHLYQLTGDKYVERSVTTTGQMLHLIDPVEATISPEDLLPPR